MTRRRSSWGSVRRLASGRFQARYTVASAEYLAPRTFRAERDAQAFLATALAKGSMDSVVAPRRATSSRRLVTPRAN